MIVSMATESYKNWLFHFLVSLETEIPEEKKVIFLINFEKSTSKKFKRYFPNVQFIDEKKDLIPKDQDVKGAYKVTYLKGEFLEKAYIRHGEAALWIDCTALIRKSPAELLDKLENLDVLLMRRNFNIDFEKSVYAAEIFGMNDLNTIQEYRANCEKRKSEWFADQLALCEIRTQKRDYIEFGKWSNFYYEENANSWSDRGKTGSGINSKDDYDFTEKKFIEDLSKRVDNYQNNFEEFMQEEKSGKPKILIHIDDVKWCYHTTASEIAERLKDKYEFLIIEDAVRDFEKYKDWHGDLVWGRCSSIRHQKLLEKRPDLRRISFSSVTTGGELAEDRITSHLQASKGEPGIICQNQDVKFRLEYKIEKLGRNQEVFILYNGVDTDRFRPGKNKNQEPVIGFVGRTKTYQEDFIKGYSHVLKPVCERLDLKILKATNENDELEHKDMAEFYQKIDILVLLGNCEGHSNTINEAMASGIPIIAYPTGWHFENAQDTGIIWCQRNTTQLFEILSDFKDNFENYGKLGQINRKFALEKLSWGKLAKFYDSQFQKMIKSCKSYVPSHQDAPVNRKIAGIVKVKYIAEDSGMDTQFGIFRPGESKKITIEAYNYFKQNFANKFEFQDE